MSRRSARDTAFRLFYEYSVNGAFNPATMDVMRDCFDKGMNDSAWEYVRRLIAALEQNAPAVDQLIEQHSNKWSIAHMARVELSILRLGVCELRFLDGEIAPGITINECVELAKRYDSEKSAKFVNGVLAAVLNHEEAALK